MKLFLAILLLLVFAPISTSARPILVPGGMPTIQTGINAASPGDTVLVQPGRYFERITFGGRNVVVGSLFLTTQDTSYISQTIIDGYTSVISNKGTVVTFNQHETSKAELCGFTITGGEPKSSAFYPPSHGGGIYCENSSPYLHHLRIMNNLSNANGGGISLLYSSSLLESLAIYSNTAISGGGVYFGGCHNAIIKNTIIFNHGGGGFGSGIASSGSNNIFIDHCLIFKEVQPLYFTGSVCTILNCTIYNGMSDLGVIRCETGNTQLYVINSIFWTSFSPPFGVTIKSSGKKISDPQDIYFFINSDIEGNKSTNFSLSPQDSVYWLGSNISFDPLFTDAIHNDFILQKNSPCIDTGTPFFSFKDSALIDLSPSQYKGIAPDMGAFETNYGNGVASSHPSPLALTAFPNPFNSALTIRFELSQSAQANLSVFSITGQRVRTIISDVLPAGKHTLQWNGLDESGMRVSSGVYFVRLETGAGTLTRRVVFMK
jgi:hypothetical protein